MLNWNAQKVRNLTGTEIWMFIVGRMLIGFGAGALLARYYPTVVGRLAVPALIIGAVLFALASKGLRRGTPNLNEHH